MQQSGDALKYRLILIPAVFVLLSNVTSLASDSTENPVFTKHKLALRAGVYDISASTRIRVDSANGQIGTQIDLENDLNLEEKKSSSYFELSWKIKGPHALEVERFSLNRKGFETLTAEIRFGEEIYEAGATVSSYFNTDVTRISYAYIFKSANRFGLAVSAGLHITDMEVGIDEIQPIVQSADDLAVAEVTAPLPVIGLSAGYNITDRLAIFGRAQIFRLEFNEYRGTLDHATIKLEYDLSKHFGLGLGYDLFDINVDAEKPAYTGSVRFRFHGPIIYVLGAFQ